MSAQPSPVRLDDEVFDGLASRALDGDLSPNELLEFEKYLAADPHARARLEEMRAFIEELRALPHPEPSFALATRIAARVQDQAQGLSGVLLKLGIFKKMGVVFMMMAAVGAVAIYHLTNLGSSPVQTASRTMSAKEYQPQKDVEGPVTVFFEETAPPRRAANEAAPPAPPASEKTQATGAEVAGGLVPSAPKEAPVQIAMAQPAGESKDTSSHPPAVPGEASPDADGRQKGLASEAQLASREDLSTSAGENFAPEMKAKKAEAEVRRDESVARSSRVVLAPAAAAPAAAGAVAQGARKSPGLKLNQSSGWRISKTTGLSNLPSGLKATYKLKLDDAGNVVGVTKLEISDPASSAPLESALKNLTLERTGQENAEKEVEIRIEHD